MRIRPTPQTIHPQALDLEQADLWLLRKYWRGEALPHEIAHVERWLAEHPDRQATYDALRCGLADTTKQYLSDAERIARTKNILAATMQRTAGSVAHVPSPRPMRDRPLYRRWATFATATAVVVSLAAGWMLNESRVNTRHSVSQYIYTTGKGEQSTVKLPDGTIAFLDVDSRLEIPHDFATNHRTLHASGAVIFDVTHRSDAPFTVIAGPSTTRVLGTSFVVRYYPTDSVALIAVRDGKVSVGSAVLTANQEVTVSSRGVNAVQPLDPSRFAMESGVLILKPMPLVNAIAELNRWYDVDIRMADARLGSVTIEGQFGKGSQSDLADQLLLGLNAKVVREGRVLTLYPNGGSK